MSVMSVMSVYMWNGFSKRWNPGSSSAPARGNGLLSSWMPRMSRFLPGEDVMVEAPSGDVGDVAMWHRIVGWKWMEMDGTWCKIYWYTDMAVCQNLVPLVNIKIAGKWMFIPLKMVLIGIDPYPYTDILCMQLESSWDQQWRTLNHADFLLTIWDRKDHERWETNGSHSFFEGSVPDGGGVVFRNRLKNRKGFVAGQRFLGTDMWNVWVWVWVKIAQG